MKNYKTIYLLPNAVTTAALFCGFFAILSSIKGQFSHAATLIFIAMVFDGMDGRIARWTKTESAFGVEYDSLSDLVSFGLAPAVLMYQYALHASTTDPWLPAKLGSSAAFIYAVCAALRLARFNVQSESADKSFFVGLPSPSAAALIAGLVWISQRYNLPLRDHPFLAAIITISAGLAMVSNLKYYSFKTFKPEGRLPFSRAVVPALFLVLIFLEPPLMLFAIFAGYVAHGPLWSLWRFWTRHRRHG